MTPTPQKFNLEEPYGIGDKKVLRLVAKKLGLHSCSVLVKRAIQFGSRIAKQTKHGEKINRNVT